MDLKWFNAAEIEPMGANHPTVPPGNYQVVITASEERRTKLGTGTYLALTLEIIDGPHKSGKILARVTMQNSSAAAVSMGQRELSSICRATGKMAPSDSRELHDLPILVTVEVVMGYSKIAAWAPVPTGAAIRAPETQPTTPPWKRQ